MGYAGPTAIAEDIKNLKAAIAGKPVDGFMSSLGPLSVGAGFPNAYYADERTYLMAVAEAMRAEYKAITDAGLIVQVDEPEFATSWQFHPDWSISDLRAYLTARQHVTMIGACMPSRHGVCCELDW